MVYTEPAKWNVFLPFISAVGNRYKHTIHIKKKNHFFYISYSVSEDLRSRKNKSAQSTSLINVCVCCDDAWKTIAKRAISASFSRCLSASLLLCACQTLRAHRTSKSADTNRHQQLKEAHTHRKDKTKTAKITSYRCWSSWMETTSQKGSTLMCDSLKYDRMCVRVALAAASASCQTINNLIMESPVHP